VGGGTALGETPTAREAHPIAARAASIVAKLGTRGAIGVC